MTFDFSETFNMEGMSYVLSFMKSDSDMAIQYIRRYLDDFDVHRAKNFDYENILYRDYGIESEITKKATESFARRLGKLSDDINEICQELELLYPIEITVYYETAIQMVRDYWNG